MANHTYRHHPTPRLEALVNEAFDAIMDMWLSVSLGGQQGLPAELVEELMERASALQAITEANRWRGEERS